MMVDACVIQEIGPFDVQHICFESKSSIKQSDK